MERTPPPRVEAASRALRILRLITERGSVSVSEAAAALDVNPSTTSRLLDTIAAEGFAVRDQRRRFVAGPNLLRPGREAGPAPIADRLRPHLARLSDTIDETVQVSTLIGTEVAHVDHIEATGHNLVYTSPIHRRFPAHETATGRCMLAELTGDQLAALYAEHPAPPGAQAPDFARLDGDLSAIRRHGYAVNREGAEEGVVAIAASLGVIDGAHYAVFAGVPAVRLIPEKQAAIVAALQDMRAATPGLV